MARPKVAAKRRKTAPKTVAELRGVGAAGKADFTHAKKTQESYAGNLRRGKEFLAALVKQRRNATDVPADGIDTDLLEKAFDSPPNQYSAMAFELFLTQKCFTEAHPKSADTIHAAFIGLWDKM